MVVYEYSKWFVVPRNDCDVEARLICLPYAGGNAATYTGWQTLLPDNVQLLAVQLPGRASRLAEQGYDDMGELIAALYPLLRSYLDQPYILFGHSMGGRIGYELMRKARENNDRLPMHFICSGCPAPNTLRSTPPVFSQSDEEFIAYLRSLNGTPEEVLQNSELMSLLLPSLRADFQLVDNYYVSEAEQMDCPASLFTGSTDNHVGLEDVKNWKDFFVEKPEMLEFPGGHLFIEENKAELLKVVKKIFNQHLDEWQKKNCNTAAYV